MVLTSRRLGLLAAALLAPLLGRADMEAFLDSSKYNSGDYGGWVTQEFVSSDVIAPWLNFMRPFTACDDGSYYFVAPRGNVAFATPYILDAEGSLVWAPDHHYGEVYNFHVQKYKGKDYLTFWSGDDSVGGHGEGRYHMLDEHYEEYRQIEGANGIGADLHSFTITPEGTATCTLYDIHAVNVSHLRKRPDAPETGYIWDSLFQEIDIETGEALFQWRASDHFPLDDSYTGMGGATEENPWDFFHINSVEKDKFGNYLISSRFLRTIAYIDGKNGSVRWQLGGKGNSFRDLSSGEATRNVGQHDAKFTVDHDGVTFFDNRGDWYYQADGQSWGARVKLDFDEMTAELDQKFTNPARIYSFSQGSYQTLPNGNVMIGWGFNGAFTEYTSDGEVLCDAYLQPRKRFGSGDVQSYRNMKFNWTGIPKTQPSLKFHQTSLFMSWKGTTETRSWMIEAGNGEPGNYAAVATIPKEGFETRFSATHPGLCAQTYARAVALDVNGQRLATSQGIFLENAEKVCNTQYSGHKQAEAAADKEAALADLEHEHDEELKQEEFFKSVAEITSGYESSDDDTDDDPVHQDLRQQIEDLQLLFVFGTLAIITGLLVTYATIGNRMFAPFRRGGALSPTTQTRFYDPRAMMASRVGAGTGAWSSVRAFFPGSRKRWWDGSTAAGGNGHRRQASDEEDTMLSDMELSGDDEAKLDHR